ARSPLSPSSTPRPSYDLGSEHEAEIVGASIDYDLAVLQVDADGLRPLVLGDSDALVVGEPVVAIGAPLGLEGTVTSGIVSALNRDRKSTRLNSSHVSISY